MKDILEQRKKFKALELFNDAWDLVAARDINLESTLSAIATLLIMRSRDQYEPDYAWEIMRNAYETARKEMG